MIVKSASRFDLRTALLAIVAVLQIATTAMVGHAYFTARRAAAAMRAAFAPSAPTGQKPEPEEATRSAPGTITARGEATTEPKREPPAVRGWDVESITYRITETNAIWSRFAWMLRVRNDLDVAATFDATIKFHDAVGFVVSDGQVYGLTVQAGQEAEFTGTELINAVPAASVERISVDLKRVRR